MIPFMDVSYVDSQRIVVVVQVLCGDFIGGKQPVFGVCWSIQHPTRGIIPRIPELYNQTLKSKHNTLMDFSHHIRATDCNPI